MQIDDVFKLWKEYKGQTSEDQVCELYTAVLNSPEGDVVEIGSASGGTTVVLIEAAKEVGKKVYSIDPYPIEFENKASFYDSGLMSQLKQEFADNILGGKYDNIIQFNEDIIDCLHKIPDKLSVVFIDGCHEFSFVQKEYNLLLRKVVPGGIIYIHDMDWSVGQLSGLESGGLDKIPKFIKKGKVIYNMLKVIKHKKDGGNYEPA